MDKLKKAEQIAGTIDIINCYNFVTHENGCNYNAIGLLLKTTIQTCY